MRPGNLLHPNEVRILCFLKIFRFGQVRNFGIGFGTQWYRGLRGHWYDKRPPIDMRGLIGDSQSRIIGLAILRQVRNRPGSNSRSSPTFSSSYEVVIVL